MQLPFKTVTVCSDIELAWNRPRHRNQAFLNKVLSPNIKRKSASNYWIILYRKKGRGKKPYKKEEKHPYKKWSYFKEKNLRGCRKRCYSVCKADKIFAKKFSDSSLLVPLSLQSSPFLGHNCLASPPITFELYWQRVKKRKRRQKMKVGFHSKH